MACPEVVVTAPGDGSTAKEAVRNAIVEARMRAAVMCKRISDDCTGVFSDPIRVELGRIESTAPWRLHLKVTFKCFKPSGCLFPFWPILLGRSGQTFVATDEEAEATWDD
ncbi:MAG: hypothetical protein HOI47_32995 [Candidatus Scalindua sp.]|jgi:hypothetical protein|nr:hypothetical protein [Candidatus Scalindua sp.]MBT6053202.1 hypothetical protein [Candidatus Scalindua sp.]MBT6231485.1 hypothetical protein [Candidatus Scalindua sp.]